MTTNVGAGDFNGLCARASHANPVFVDRTPGFGILRQRFKVGLAFFVFLAILDR